MSPSCFSPFSFAKKHVMKLSVLDPQGFLIWLFLLFLLSIPVSIGCFYRVVHIGHPTSSGPTDERAAFTAGPASRGTVDIIWMCLSTIFTCVYVSLHPDVPEKEDQPPIKVIGRKLLWMAINVVAPELIAYVAAIEYLSASHYRKATLEHIKGWTLSQSFFADMGGFKVRIEQPSSDKEPTQPTSIPEAEDITIPTAWHFVQWLRDNSGSSWLAQHIDTKQLEVDIADKSKADSVLKLMTVLQATWLVVQTVDRACNSQPVSPLEVTTCAYVLCTVFTYCCWWQKPYGVQRRVLLLVPNLTRPKKVSGLGFYLTPFNRGDSADKATDRINNIAVVASGCIGVLIGAIHCTFWNAAFASSNAQLLWRICCLAQIVTSVLMALCLYLDAVLAPHGNRQSEIIWISYHRWQLILPAFFACFIQFCARFVIFILIGYSFWSLPAGVYKTTHWTWSWLPHIG